MSFGYIQFSPKNKRKKVNLRFNGSKVKFICSLFEKQLAWKNHFDFVWPLEGKKNKNLNIWMRYKMGELVHGYAWHCVSFENSYKNDNWFFFCQICCSYNLDFNYQFHRSLVFRFSMKNILWNEKSVSKSFRWS